ncbi:hypothetical protein J437_LFUL007500 [Ladona fulva]|uniref:sphingomyelin phosphodiesterase n=1 Tax=Ladona fulva TaxID=123851 RepID=A0A8K0KH55_LADFU|nr:hypothetical protein J437_LFUL007500 [Ladona fulva]
MKDTSASSGKKCTQVKITVKRTVIEKKMTTTLTVFTLNCWGIPLVSKHRSARMCAIAKQLSEKDYDFACLQEVWAVKDYQLLKKKLSGSLPHSHYFYSGVLGSGLCIFSKHVIENAIFHRWPLNGYAHKVQHGDWFGGKGIALCTFIINTLKVNVYNVHMHAEYSPEGPNKYLAHRVSQAFDTAQFIHVTSAYADISVVAGDFNAEPADLCYRVLEQHADLLNTFCMASKVFNDNGMGTNECIRNSYACPKAVQNCPQGKQIDHIMYKAAIGKEVKVLSYGLPFPKRVAGQDFSYSDHEAVSATLVVTNSPSDGFQPQKNRCKEELAALGEARAVVSKGLRSVSFDRKAYSLASACLILFLVASIGNLTREGSIFYFILIALRAVAVILLVFTFFMASVWHSLEKNALLAVDEALKVVLMYPPNYGDESDLPRTS